MEESSLESITRRAGALINPGATVAAHYGSPMAEVAVCVRAVGLVDRSDLVTICITGEADAVADVARRYSGFAVSTGGWAWARGAHWCGASREMMIVLAEPGGESLEEALRRSAGIEVADCSADWCAIALVGPASMDLLAALNVVEEPRLAAPFGRAAVGRRCVYALLQSDRRAILMTKRSEAAPVWHTIRAAGRPFGLSYVGAEAQHHFAIAERMAVRAPRGPAD